MKSRLKAGIARILNRFREEDEKIFFSQFGEDAFLQSYFRSKAWTRYGNSNRMDKGFYVDVGAFSPIEKSNTYWFYLQGWHGINIEPTPGSQEHFAAARPRDVNLRCAISESEGEIELFSWGGSVFNTASAQVAAEYEREYGLGQPACVVVRSRTLCSVLDEHVPPGVDISFFSVDVEGLDLMVLKSNDWERFRPELVLVELHETQIGALIDSDIAAYLDKVGYQLYGWIPPSLVFIRRDILSSGAIAWWDKGI